MAKRLILVVAFLCLLVAVSGLVTAQEADAQEVTDLLAQAAAGFTAGDLSLDEQFDESDAWETYNDQSSDLRVEDGVYRVETGPGGYIWGLNNQVHTDVMILVDTEQRSDFLNNGYGVMCRASISNNGDGYYFLISGDGYYAIFASDGGDTFDTLVDWTASDVIHQGTASNRLGALCSGSHLAIYANGQLLAETEDTRFNEGYAGFAAGVYEDGTIDVAFDNLQIWEVAPSGGKGSTSQTLAAPLTAYAGDWQDAVAELENDEIIPSGGHLIFQEDSAFFDGEGNWFTPLAARAPATDIVMAGELTFTIGNPDAFEVCTLTSRIDTERNQAVTYVDVGITNTGDLMNLDVSVKDQDATTVEFVPLGLDLSQPHHLLIILSGDTATVYVDGQQAAADVEVVARDGTYGISLLGEGPNARCEGRNIWAYEIPFAPAEGCVIRTSREVNERSGPGTDFDRAGQLDAGAQMTVTGQAVGSDGQTWWQLEDGAWVRDDVVDAVGNCVNVPVVEP